MAIELEVHQFGRKWSKTALHFFLFSAIIGMLLRYINLSFISWVDYRNLIHTHSHIALLGWMHLAYTTVLVYLFRPNRLELFKPIQLITLISVLGMMLSFPFEGYGFFSISFSTLFIFATYWFTYQFVRTRITKEKLPYSEKFAIWSLVFLVISSFGPWTLGPLMVFGDGQLVLYNLSVYFYLHFAYNGFFVIALFAIVLRHLEKLVPDLVFTKAKWFGLLIISAVIPSYALSSLWADPPAWVHIIGGVSGILQLVGLIIGIPLLTAFIKSINSRFNKIIMFIAIMALGLKIVMQMLSGIPIIEDFTYDTRLYTVIGYIHLVMLGCLSLFIISYLIEIGFYRLSLIVKTGIGIFLLGFIVSELYLFGNGLFLQINESLITNYSKAMFITGIIMVIGILIFWIGQMRKPTSSET